MRDYWLYAVAVAIVLLVLPGCASVRDGMQDDGSMVYTLTPEQVAQCLKEGGCSTVTLQYEQSLVREAAKHFCGVEI